MNHSDAYEECLDSTTCNCTHTAKLMKNTKTVLVLRSCNPDFTSYGGFRWPKEGKVSCPDWNPEPRFRRHYPLEYGVRVKATGETHFRDLVSARQASKALGLIIKFCQ